ncbi:helix-turn-helix domain-containing protein [Mangrovimonas spongiae]|uniref:Helix-turn-helix domain-containing protein n=1 Tax=Mangrovimonas spongiae TaxID=2494697 RepID=A0A3R9NR69_9FLAO|nr:helix-turn-helix domain-containing protein [Mangrovimonas spongiae]RSK39850.1 helix-turn-helix domain-containing protein [Mangrovimonas spongiae]
MNVFFVANMFSQQNDLYTKAEELVSTNPDEAIKISEHILKTALTSRKKALANVLLAQSYIVKGDYNKAITYAFDEHNFMEEIPLETKVEVNILKSELLRKLYLYNLSYDFSVETQQLVKKLPSKSIQDYLGFKLSLEQSKLFLDKREASQALKLLNNTNTQYRSCLEDHPEARQEVYLTKERAFSDISYNDSAMIYINNAITLNAVVQGNDVYKKAQMYKELGHLYLQQRAFKQSEEALFIALRFASIIENTTLLMQINQDLAVNYLASNKKSQHKVYNDEFLVLNNQVEQIEQESINNLYNQLQNLGERRLEINKEKQSRLRNIFFICALLVLILGAFVVFKSESRKKRLREIINYLEISRTNYLETKSKPKAVTKKRKSKGIVISEETEQAILGKLNKFEKSQKFLNSDMSLAVLAGQFETNTKYLSEVIHKHYNDNFNTFINKLRVNYIIKQLQKDPNYVNYKISFLAEESGFSSHSSFTTVFKSIVGMSPAKFINLIREERKELNEQQSVS